MIYPGGYIPAAEQAPDDAEARAARNPTPGEKTERQDQYLALFGNMGLLNGNGGDNPCGFPGYGRLYTGSYPVYRFILDHPRVRQARQQVYAALMQNPWALEAREGTPEAVKQFIIDKNPPQQIYRFKREAFRAVDYGNYKFEKVWASAGGRRWVEELKPLAVDTTSILVYKNGKFAGVRYGGPDEWLSKRESLCVTYDGEAGNLYGRSRLENIRQYAWRDWLDAATQLQWTCLKIAGKLAIITTPSGTYTDAAGNVRDWREVAMKAGQAIADVRSNGTIWIPSGRLPEQRNKDELDFAKLATVTIDVKDFGTHSDAISGFLERLRASEDLMFAGYHRSSRTGMESQNGSRADAQQHTDTDTSDIELTDGELADDYNEQKVDDELVTNFGEKMRGAVRFVPAKLKDQHRETDMKLLEWLFTNPSTADSAVENTEWDAIFKRRGVPPKGGKKVEIETVEADGGKGDEMGNDTTAGGGGNDTTKGQNGD